MDELSENILRYPTGEKAETGDAVLIEDGRTPGVVTDVIASEQALKLWELEEPGLMIKAAPLGLVFWPAADVDPVVFVSRGEAVARPTKEGD